MDGHVTFVSGDDGSPAAREPTICAPRGQVPAARAMPCSRWTATLHPPGVALSGELAGFAMWRDGTVRVV